MRACLACNFNHPPGERCEVARRKREPGVLHVFVGTYIEPKRKTKRKGKKK